MAFLIILLIIVGVREMTSKMVSSALHSHGLYQLYLAYEEFLCPNTGQELLSLLFRRRAQ